jgi:hypothetical protein
MAPYYVSFRKSMGIFTLPVLSQFTFTAIEAHEPTAISKQIITVSLSHIAECFLVV